MANYKEDEWDNGEEVLGGELALIRKNVSLAAIDSGAFPYELIVHLVYEDVQEDGLPASVEETELLGENEERIADHFCGQFGGKFALCVTSGGVRDQFLYLPEPLTDEQIADELEAISPTVDYDFGMRKDPDWSIYKSAMSKVDTEADSAPQSWWKRLFGRG